MSIGTESVVKQIVLSPSAFGPNEIVQIVSAIETGQRDVKAWELVKHWNIEGREKLRQDVPRIALDAVTPDGESVKDFAGRVLDISAGGLTRRARLNSAGDNEGGFLDPLREVVATGITPADRLLNKYENEWGGDLSHIYEEFSF